MPSSPLFTRRFVLLCTAGMFGFAQNYAIVPVIPLVVLAYGGDAALAGAALAAFSVSSLVIRPFIGRAVDMYGRERVFAVGTATLAASGYAYLLPGLATLFIVRLIAGAGWAAYNTAGNVTVAALAPSSRRAEASGYWGMSHSIGAMAAPTAALLLLAASGHAAVFAFAGTVGLAGFAAALLLLRGAAMPPRETRTRGFWEGLIEKSALLPMSFEALATTSQTLFVAFLPLYALSLGIPLNEVAAYFALIGLMIVVARGLLARLSDVIGRSVTIAISGSAVLVALALMLMARDFVGVAVAGLLYAAGAALGSPTTLALAIDRSDPAHRGAAMATYSMGFQVANAGAAAVWGVLIATQGYHAAFAGAIAVQATLLLLLFATRHELEARKTRA
jgi:MFS family permease